jgi:hypothetical protein
MLAVDWATLDANAANFVVTFGGMAAIIGFLWNLHQKHRERTEQTEGLMDIVAEHGRSLARIEKKLMPNGKNTRNPGDLLAIICDHLGIEMPE